jgi:ABC-type dipeptide/oligopeptide/nickel transport system permease subunit
MTVMTQMPNSPEVVEADLDELPRSTARQAWHTIRSSRSSVISLIVVAIYLLVGLFSLTPLMDHKIADKVGGVYDPPRWGAPNVLFGTDIQGRSVFWRTLYGTRVALIITIVAGMLSMSIGIVTGVIAGYFGGWIDSLIVWLFTTLSSVPWILLVIAIAYSLQTHETLNDYFGGLPIVILSLGLTDWVMLCRLLRGEVLKHRQRDYVTAARAAGAGHARILIRHIFPNVFHLVIITFSLDAVAYVQAEVALTFLGLGITSKPSWGRMIDDAKLELLRGVWWQLTAATAAIFILCLALNILGDALRDALDPRLRGVD